MESPFYGSFQGLPRLYRQIIKWVCLMLLAYGNPTKLDQKYGPRTTVTSHCTHCPLILAYLRFYWIGSNGHTSTIFNLQYLQYLTNFYCLENFHTFMVIIVILLSKHHCKPTWSHTIKKNDRNRVDVATDWTEQINQKQAINHQRTYKKYKYVLNLIIFLSCILDTSARQWRG